MKSKCEVEFWSICMFDAVQGCQVASTCQQSGNEGASATKEISTNEP